MCMRLALKLGFIIIIIRENITIISGLRSTSRFNIRFVVGRFGGFCMQPMQNMQNQKT